MCSVPRDAVAASARGREETKSQDDKKRPKSASPDPAFPKWMTHQMPQRRTYPAILADISGTDAVSPYV
jgi:hypothetical protein